MEEFTFSSLFHKSNPDYFYLLHIDGYLINLIFSVN